MKRIASIVMTAMLLVILSVSSVFAATGFELVESSPAAGYEKVQAQNVMVKLYFSEEISAEATQKANEDAFSIKDAKGKDVKFTVYYNDKDATNVNLMIEDTLGEDAEYKVAIADTMVNDAGEALGKKEVVDFKTTKPNNTGYVILMTAMIVVMVFMTMRDQKKAMTEEEAAKKAAAAVQTNPYKLAKEKNISVEEAQKIIAKEKAKADKKVEKASKKPVKEEPVVPEKKVYKVKTKRVTKMHK